MDGIRRVRQGTCVVFTEVCRTGAAGPEAVARSCMLTCRNSECLELDRALFGRRTGSGGRGHPFDLVRLLPRSTERLLNLPLGRFAEVLQLKVTERLTAMLLNGSRGNPLWPVLTATFLPRVLEPRGCDAIAVQ